MLKGNALIAQGGGPTVVINQSLVGAILAAQNSELIDRIYGALHGVSGIINEDILDLSEIPKDELEIIACTPSSAMRSTRDKPDDEYCKRIVEVLKAHNVRYFFYNGGNDSADTCKLVSEMADNIGYELIAIHIPKTIDNDLLVTDHCPGFGSAAKFVSQAFAGIDLDMRSIPGVYIGIVMGRDAGFLTAASALAKTKEGDGPHLIYVPEGLFSKEKFVRDVDKVYKKYGRCVIAVSEGIRNSDGEPVISTILENKEFDAHGNVQLSGSGALGDFLSKILKDSLNIKRVRADTFGYLQRSFLGVVSKQDSLEARSVGSKAVEFSTTLQKSGSVAIKRVGNYEVDYFLTPLETVAKNTKPMPPEFYDEDKAMVTEEFINYVKPLVGDLPTTGLISAPSVERKIIN